MQGKTPSIRRFSDMKNLFGSAAIWADVSMKIIVAPHNF